MTTKWQGKSCYLALKMRGVPFWNFPMGLRAADYLRYEYGMTVFSPIDHDEDMLQGREPPADGKQFKEIVACLTWDFARIAETDCMVVLPGWETSTGVHWEMTVAYALQKPILLFPSMTPIPVPDFIINPTRWNAHNREGF